MRNRKLNRVLVPMVLLIWGLIAYRFGSGEDTVSEGVHPPTAESLALADGLSTVDSFRLLLPYRDPFLGRTSGRKVSQDAGTKRSPEPSPANVPLPDIQYQGSISGQEDGKVVGILQWEGKSASVSIGDQWGPVKVRFISREEIVLQIGEKLYRIAQGQQLAEGAS